MPLDEIEIKIGSMLSCSQHQLQNCHHDNHRSRPPCDKLEKTSCGIYPLQQTPPVTVIPPQVLKYPDKHSESPTNKSHVHPLAPGTTPHDFVKMEQSHNKSTPCDDVKCLTGDGQNFEPLGGVRWAMWLRSYRPLRMLQSLLDTIPFWTLHSYLF